jgi:hypothetical protein
MVERAGVGAKLDFPAHPHMLRHACGFALANKGHDTRALQAYLGHRNIQHTVRYTEPSPGRFKEGQRAPPADLFPRLPTTAAGRGKIRFRQHIGIHRHIRGSARPATSAPILTYLRRARWLASGRRIALAE